jgi:predicted dehydrogenase
MGNRFIAKKIRLKFFSAADQYEHQATSFSNHLINKTKVDYDLKDAKKNMKVLDATFKSIKKGSWVKV